MLPIDFVVSEEEIEEAAVFEEYAKKFQAPLYDSEAVLQKALAILPPPLQQDRYWLALAVIFVNVPALYWTINTYVHPGKSYVAADALKKNVFRKLSSGELFMGTLALHLFNDVNKLPKDGLSGLRSLDSYNLDLALHAIRISAGGLRQ
jgi:hypothetical protein